MSGEVLPTFVIAGRCLVEDKMKQVLLLKRSENDSWAKGVWEIPGGKWAQSQSLDSEEFVTIGISTLREVKEETGLEVNITSPFILVDSSEATLRKYEGQIHLALAALGEIVGGEFSLSSEHDDHIWLPMEEALKENITTSTRAAISLLGQYSLSS